MPPARKALTPRPYLVAAVALLAAMRALAIQSTRVPAHGAACARVRPFNLPAEAGFPTFHPSLNVALRSVLLVAVALVSASIPPCIRAARGPLAIRTR